MTVLHRQGFDRITDVERCILEPGGTFYIQRKMPPVDELHQQELLQRLGELQAKVDLLLARKEGAGAPV
jgi:hypothetical protein